MHPAEDLEGIIAQLHTYAVAVRRTLRWPVLGVGLWLPASVASQLSDDHASLLRLRETLVQLRLEVTTLNGFPYQGFQSERVKYAVYRPDWSEPERLTYTTQLAHILSALLPDDVHEGSISTLPLGWRDRDLTGAPDMLRQLVEELDALHVDEGRRIRIAVEPEPGCAIETMSHGIEVVQHLAPEWIGMCLDACHLAVQFEDAASVLDEAAAKHVSVVKAQVSNALRVPDPSERAWLQEFIEHRFLHQVRRRSANGIASVDDLDDRTAGILQGEGEWRVHYHVPLHFDDPQRHTTQPELRDTLRSLVGQAMARTHHLEVETYTWTVLPPSQRPVGVDGLVDGIAGELQWTAEQLIALGLEPIT
jgi:hypothetical protein